jgi:NitT/TauT family transport system ATP-binding protein
MTKARPILHASQLSMTFPNGNGGLRVLEGVDLALFEHEFVCIVGPSGCGKTTLLRILGGLQDATSGEVCFGDEPIARPRRRIGFVFQQANLMPWRTALENIYLPLELQGMPVPAMRDQANKLIELVGLTGFEASYPRDLSGGMAQRVAIARALVHDPEVLLLDEPFGSLDALTRERMAIELMRIWKAQRSTVLMVTHSISEAVLLADRVIVLSDRPASVLLNLVVDLPRPRTIDLTYTREFGELAASVRGMIRSGG